MVFPTSVRRAAAGAYHSPYAPKYYTPPHIAGVNLKRGLRYGAISAGFGVSTVVFCLFFFGDVPRVRQDILQKIPVLGEHWNRTIPPEDNPF
ncbi:hypothetical protein VTN02DRAFT_2273 [Thermoascus thermophilus]